MHEWTPCKRKTMASLMALFFIMPRTSQARCLKVFFFFFFLTLDSEKTKRLLTFHKLSGSILFSSLPGFGNCNVSIILSNTRPLQAHQGCNACNCLTVVENKKTIGKRRHYLLRKRSPVIMKAHERIFWHIKWLLFEQNYKKWLKS